MKLKIALIQDSPIFFDKDATITKMIRLIEENKESDLIVFPESYVPGYPRGFSFGSVIGSRNEEGRALYAKYHKNSISSDGEEIQQLINITKSTNTYLVFGFTEKKKENGSLYCSMAYISPTDGLLGVHRKIKPTGTERLIWAESGGESLVTFDTKIGILGGLICWENYMPLARLSMYKKGVQIYIAPTADSRDEWSSTMKHIALEGRCFVLGCNQYFTKSMYPDEYQHLVKDEEEEMCTGGSMIVSPLGKILADPVFGKSSVIKAEINLDDVTRSKLDFDANGHYTRDDIFNYSVNGQPEIKKEQNNTIN
ncbi:MAG: nitrilase [Saprospiraceae bacterium]|jgi:nitrilase